MSKFDAAKEAYIVRNLTHFIEEHDGCKVEGISGSDLIVSSLVHYHDIDGPSIERYTEVIPATMSNVRDWLGY